MDVYDAMADPVRRNILELLNLKPLTAGEIASRFAISRPAISRHLRVLRQTGLVEGDLEGRHRVYRLQTAAFREVDAWLEQYRDVWAARLDALETEVYRTRRERSLGFDTSASDEEIEERTA